MTKNMPHGAKPLRGLITTSQSTIDGQAKFGRMFRWLEPAQRPKTADEMLEVEDLMQALAKIMVTEEFEKNILEGIADKKDKRDIHPDKPITVDEPEDENPAIAAGYTYFGQFVDHDLTFDPASFLQQMNDPDALVDFRTPRFDLDCLYGRGPADQPYLYQAPDRVQFLHGAELKVPNANRFDLPRLKTGEHTYTALIGDKRNDENKIVSQVQSLFLQFHNKVFDEVHAKFPDLGADEKFSETQRIVRWCYQWIVLRDFLEKICDTEVYKTVRPAEAPPELQDASGKKVLEDGKPVQKTVVDPLHKGPNLSHYKAHGDAYVPVEFAAAAYRFGHSMVRPSYALNDVATSKAKLVRGGVEYDFARIPIFVGASTRNDEALNGLGQQLPHDWGIDWDFFFGEVKQRREDDKSKRIPQPSYRIDHNLVDPLGLLPEFESQIQEPKSDEKNKRIASLAFRNLIRGVSMGLPSGERIATMLGFEPLSEDKLWNKQLKATTPEKWVDWGCGKDFFNAAGNKRKKWLEQSTPLWFYILKEAEMQAEGRKLGKVGSTIVAETFYGIMWADHYSYIFQEPNWSPGKENIAGLTDNLNMLELTKFVTGASSEPLAGQHREKGRKKA